MKKIFGYIICVIIIAFSYCIAASASDIPSDDLTGEFSFVDENGEALLSYLDISCSFGSADYVTRAEFAELVAKALKVDGTLLPQDDPFIDVYNYDLRSGYIDMLKSMEIIQGSDENMFYPKRAITYNEAYTMALRAMNYGYFVSISADAYSLARQAGLSHNISNVNSQEVTPQDALVLAYNMLTCTSNKVEETVGNHVKYESEKGYTLLEDIWGISIYEGVLNSTPVSDLYSQKAMVKNNLVEIGDKIFTDENGFYENMLGKNVLAYYDDDNSIIYMHANNNEYAYISAEDKPQYSNFSVSYYESNNVRRKRIADDFSIIYNGRAFDYKGQDFMPSEGGNVILIDNDSDGEYEVVLVSDYTYMHIKEVYTDSDNNTVLQDFNSNTNDVVVPVNGVVKYYLNGQECDKDSIVSGMTARIIASSDDVYFRIYVSDETVEGVANGFFNGEDPYVMINDTKFMATKYFVDNYTEYLKMDSTCTFKISDDGYLIGFDNLIDVYQYGYILSAFESPEVDDRVQMRILSPDNKKNVYTFAEKVLINGKSCYGHSKEAKKEFISEGEHPYQIVRYALNDEGLISKIDTETENFVTELYEEQTNSDDKLKSYISKRSVKYKTTGIFTPYARVSGGTTFIVVPKNLNKKAYFDKDCFEIVNTSFFSNDINYLIDVFDIDSAGFAKAVVVYYDILNREVGATDKYGLVDKVQKEINEDNEVTYKIYYWNEGRFLSSFLKESKAYLAEDVCPGDFIRFTEDVDGNITNIAFDYRYGTDEDGNDRGGYVSGEISADGLYATVFAKPYRISGSSMLAQISGEMQVVPLDNAKFVIFDTRSNHVRPGTIDDILDIVQVGEENADEVFITKQYSFARTCIIYK